MDGNVIAALVLGAIAWGGIISLAVMRFKPSHADVEQIADSRIILHENETAKSAAKDLVPRLQGVVKAMEDVAGVTKGQGESGGRRLPAGADFEHQPCRTCGQVYIIDVMQRMQVYREALTGDALRSRSMFPSMRDRNVSPFDIRRERLPDTFFCATHKHEGVEIMVYLYGGRRRDYNEPDVIVPGSIDYFKVVPARGEHWELAGESLAVPSEEPAKVRVKRGRKSAADRLREATARGEDVTAESPSVIRTRAVPQDKAE